MTKTMAAIVVHYGLEYLQYAVRSLYDAVDEIHLWYVQYPSFGKLSDRPCPEAESDLYIAAKQYDPDGKVVWHKGIYYTEGDHRRVYEKFAKDMGFDVVVVCDTDEVWDSEALKKAIGFARRSTKQRFRVPMVHLWQDYDAICKDLAQPVRFYKPDGDGDDYVPLEVPVWHFGYAIDDDLMAYKWGIHGHRDELREGWLENTWLARKTEDVHPTNLNFWDAEQYDKNKLPAFMKESPRWTTKRLKPWPSEPKPKHSKS